MGWATYINDFRRLISIRKSFLRINLIETRISEIEEKITCAYMTKNWVTNTTLI